MKRILLIAAGFIGLLVVAALVVPFLVPKDVYRNQIEKAATNALQRDVTLTGDVKISVFPRIAASISGVTVANPEGFDRPNMIEAGELRGSVKWLPLLSRRVDVQEIAFVDASVDLHRKADGTANWEFASASEPSDTPEQSGGGFDAGIASARLQNASLTYRDDAAGSTYELKELDLQASMQAMNQPVDIKGSGLFQGEKFDVTLDLDSPEALTSGTPASAKFALQSALVNANYDGSITMGDASAIAGTLTLSAPSILDLTKFADVEMPYNVAPLGGADMKATLSGSLEAPQINFETLAIKGQLIDAGYTGSVSLGEAITVDGKLSAVLPQAGDIATEMGIELPAADALERVEIKGSITGPVDALNLANLDVTHTGALLNASYMGAVGLGGDGSVNGQVNASSNELRALLKAADVEMAPGETLKTFKVDSAIKGSFKKLSLTGLTLTLDDITGKGTAGVDLTGERPKITGDLDMGPLDLSPFLGEGDTAETPAQASNGWSKEPLDLAGLKAVDADIKIRTSALTIGNVKLTDAALATTLDNGKLVTDLSQFKAFGGDWNGKLNVNAQGATPAVDFAMNGSGVGMSSLLGTLAGFDKLTGTGGFNVTGAATGNSLYDIVNALDGKVTTNLTDGALKGLNVSQLVRSAQSLQTALTTGSLKNLDFSSALSPSAETDFTSFDTVLTITDGVANVDLMKLINPVLGIDGSGQINLGGQALDMRLATSVDKKGQGDGSVIQLNGIPVPVRISGAWTNLKVSPDTSGIQSALKAELGNKLKDELTGKIGGDAGSILGAVLGGNQTQTAPATDGSQPATKTPTIEDAAEQAARDALGGLFNKKKKKEEPATPESN
ncbi:MAG: AsmA family protein [Alphaproteobacteria bacterium]|nr:AsmA family protein [Alphaproteobacteria bacterium]MBU2083705.1 AsmA family protein [Alphaproteobacteria bacterium]MBU2143350.1 AsmA family protein [Alphaproteobacteria bacterium]MBU2195171.1 AsmA family protein [Alphaproteobacteria bacterium]